MTTSRQASDLDSGEEPDGEPSEQGSVAPPSGEREGQKSGRWTVAEQFERDGFHYRLMRRPVAPDDHAPRLTRREQQAVAHACDGCGNKRIAELLGVAPSTVGVLLFRAAAKLGVKSRQELLQAYRQAMQPPDGTDP